MPIFSGPLTQRLQQLVGDIGAFFTAQGVILAAIRAHLATLEDTVLLLTDIRGLLTTLMQEEVGPTTTLSTIKYQLVSAANSLTQIDARDYEHTPKMSAALQYLTQAGDGTPLGENLYKSRVELYELGGVYGSHRTLADLYTALQSPAGPRLQTIIEKLDILLLEKLGTPPNALTGLELLQLVADCVCQLNSKFLPLPPIPPGPSLIPATHQCAPSKPLLFVVRPEDWYEWSPGLWAACPASLYAGMEQWVIVQREFISGAGGTHPVLRVIDGQREAALDFCNVTGSSQGEIVVLDPQHGRDVITQEATYVAFGSGLAAVGVTDGPNGCKTIALLNSELPDVYWRLNCDLGGADGSDKPNNTYYFYAVTPN